MLQTMLPPSLEARAVVPIQDAEAMLLIIHKLAEVLVAFTPQISCSAVQGFIAPVPAHLHSIFTFQSALAVDLVLDPCAGELGPVLRSINAEAISLATHELAEVRRAVITVLHAFAMETVIYPMPLENHATSARSVNASSMGQAPAPLANEHVAVARDEAAGTLRHVPRPLAIIRRTIWPPLHSFTMPRKALPLPGIPSTTCCKMYPCPALRCGPPGCRHERCLTDVVAEIKDVQIRRFRKFQALGQNGPLAKLVLETYDYVCKRSSRGRNSAVAVTILAIATGKCGQLWGDSVPSAN